MTSAEPTLGVATRDCGADRPALGLASRSKLFLQAILSVKCAPYFKRADDVSSNGGTRANSRTCRRCDVDNSERRGHGRHRGVKTGFKEKGKVPPETVEKLLAAFERAGFKLVPRTETLKPRVKTIE
jgi:hypothetical protein